MTKQRWRKRTGLQVFAVSAVAAVMVGALGGATFASFTATASSPGPTVSTKKIFPGVRTSAAFDIRDASGGGAAINASSPLAAAGDGLVMTTSAWATAFAGTRYLEARFGAPLAGNIAVTGTVATATMTPTSGTTCVYFELRTTSAVIAAFGSAATPEGCFTTAQTFSLSAPAVVSTDQASDLSLRVYARSTTSATMTADLVALAVTTPHQTATIYPVNHIDASSGTPVTSPWSLATVDTVAYQNQSNWPNNFTNGRYITYGFPAFTPGAAIVSGGTWTHTYKDANGSSQCYWFEVYAGAALIGTHGSATAPYCNNTNAFVTNTVALPEITSAAAANSISVRMHGTNGGGSKRSLDERVTLGINYYVN